MSWSLTINEKISAAISSGELEMPESLAGKPLDLGAYFATPHHIRMGYSILANSGFTPMEVDIRNEMNALEDRVKATSDEQEVAEIRERLSCLAVQLDSGL